MKNRIDLLPWYSHRKAWRQSQTERLAALIVLLLALVVWNI